MNIVMIPAYIFYSSYSQSSSSKYGYLTCYAKIHPVTEASIPKRCQNIGIPKTKKLSEKNANELKFPDAFTIPSQSIIFLYLQLTVNAKCCSVPSFICASVKKKPS